MTVDQVRRAYRAQPFRPFQLRLADGREYTVRHPEFMMFSNGDRHVYVNTPEGLETIDLRLVASLHVQDDDGTLLDGGEDDR